MFATLAFSITNQEWVEVGNAFNNLNIIQNAQIRNIIEETRFEIDTKIMEHNREGKDATQLRQELKVWEKMDKALPATLVSKQRVSSVRDFQLFVSYNIVENGEKGIKFFPRFTIDNARFSEGLVAVYFYWNGNAFKDFNNSRNEDAAQTKGQNWIDLTTIDDGNTKLLSFKCQGFFVISYGNINLCVVSNLIPAQL
jgi:hypothetical protein